MKTYDYCTTWSILVRKVDFCAWTWLLVSFRSFSHFQLLSRRVRLPLITMGFDQFILWLPLPIVSLWFEGREDGQL